MEDIVLVSAARTAIGGFGGALCEYKVSDLGGMAMKEAIQRAGLEPSQVDEAVYGCVGTAAEDAYMSRVCAIKAGMPIESTAITVNRLCASGVQSIVTAGMEIGAEFADVCVAGGAESMSNLPYYLRKVRFGERMGHGELEDGIITSVSDPFTRVHMGITAENVAEKYSISREAQDEYALLSQQRAEQAIKAGKFQDEIFPVEYHVDKKTTAVFDTDEHPRFGMTIEKLAKLRPAFKEGGTVTAGNASGVNDGAAAMVVMRESRAKELGCKPLVRLKGAAAAGVDPMLMGTGPIPAVQKLLTRTGLTLDAIGLIELNEAFAAQALACIQELKLDMNRVNVNGGAIALGHPLGCSGAYITVKLIYEMIRRGEQYGIVTMCIGGGQGMAVLFELCA